MRKIIIFIFCGLVFAGCKQDPMVENDDNQQIVVFFSSQSILASKLKSAATETEKIINKVILFGFDASDNFVPKSKWIKEVTNLSTSLELEDVNRKVKTIWAIANPTTAMENIIPEKVADLTKQTASYPNDNPPTSPFLMSGKGAVAGYSANIKLFFAVAKVKIISDGFQITSVEVQKTPDKAFVFDDNLFNWKTGDPPIVPKVPTGSGRVTYASPTTLPDPLVFYVAENDATTTANSTKFVVKGTLDNVPIDPYTIELKIDQKIIPIKRNTCYTVTISPVSQSTGTVTISIPDWEEGENDDHSIK